MRKGRDHGKHPLLLRPAEMGLEAHDVIDGASAVVLPQLHHRIGLLAGFGIFQANGLQGAVAQGILSPPGHDLHGHAAFKDLFVLKAMHRRFLCIRKLPDKVQILLPIHGAVDVIRGALVIAGGEPAVIHIQRFKAHQWGRRVIEVQALCAAEIVGNRRRHGIGGQGAGGNDRRTLGDLRELLMDDLDVLVLLQRLGDGRSKCNTIHCQCAACFHAVFLGTAHDQAAQVPQFFLQKANGVRQRIAPERVGADQFTEQIRLMGRGLFLRLHLNEPHLEAHICQLPRRFASGQARADYGNIMLHWRVPPWARRPFSWFSW